MLDATQGTATVPRSYLVVAVGFLVAMVDGYDTLMLAFIAPLFAKEWAAPPEVVGEIFASSYAGAALGATVIGIAADRFGRKTLLLVSLATAGILTMLCAWSSSPGQLMVLRAFAGLGLGGALSTVTAITAASTPERQRRATVTRMFLGFPVGAIVGGAVTAAAMTLVGWRGIFLGGGICALLLIPVVAATVRHSLATETGVGSRTHARKPLRELIAQGRFGTTVLFCVCVFLMLLTSYFLVNWIPTVLALNGMTPARAAVGAVILNCGGIVGTLILSFVIDRTRPLAPVVGCLCAGAILIALLGHAITSSGNARLLLVFAVGLLIIGAQGGIPALCIHFYPPAVYATATGVSLASGRLGSIIGPLIAGYLVAGGSGWERLFQLAALPAFSAAIALAALAVARIKGRPT
jgi:MFS transporter, AAHS family, 4-hydroxybenzoate transporter